MKPKYYGLIQRIYLKGKVLRDNLSNQDNILMENLIRWGEVVEIPNGGWGKWYEVNKYHTNRLIRWYGKDLRPRER
jgi:hypothetical protein